MYYKIAKYKGVNGKPMFVPYDADAPCWYCGNPVGEASIGGTVVCPSCDCGSNRDGTKWTWIQYNQRMKHFRRMKEKAEEEVKK